MSETKEEIALERDRLRGEVDNLKQQLATIHGPAAAGRAAAPQHRFQLSEGDRQELEIRGVVNIGGRLMTKADVEAAMAKAGPDAAGHNDQTGVQIADAPEATRIDPGVATTATGPGIAGVDYVWPSVERGKIDPAVAGTPGISGPPAERAPRARAESK